jgi:quercetin dioxygenase-like cupin family protein
MPTGENAPMDEAKLTPWLGVAQPNEETLRSLLKAEGLDAYRWSNGPGDRYAAHRHPFHKVIYCVEGSITFTLPELDSRSLLMTPGDRLDLPAGVLHAALVGEQGVVCLEAHL